jgi:hypothetical protein
MFRFLLALALFFVIANPAMFKLTRKVFGSVVASPEGLPTQAGVLLHALVFVLAGRFVGRFSRYADEAAEKYEEEKEKYEEEKEKYADEMTEKYADEMTEKYTLAPGDY